MTFSPQSFMKSFDLFSQPFIFFVGDKKQKSTLIGGFISLTLIIVSSSYFYYLISMYFQNKIEPKINSNSKVENNYMEVLIQDNFFLFEMKVEGITLTEYEKKVGKKFLKFEVDYVKASNGFYSTERIPIIECNDPNIHGYLCLEESKIQNKTLSFDSISSLQSVLSIQIKYCDPQTEQNCATETEIVNTILKPSNYFQIFTKIQQYSSESRSYQIGYKSEIFYFDPNLYFYTRMSIIKATSKVIEGLIIQTSETKDMIHDYQRKDAFLTKENLIQRMQTNGFGLITFELNQERKQIIIQHSMITEIFAQFMSIFNFLLTLGILAKMLAENKIVDDINDILLKKYYKKTAANLLHQREYAISNKNKNTISKSQQQQYQVKEKEQQFDHFDEIKQTNNQINQTMFFQNKKQYFKMSTFKRIQSKLSQLFLRRNLQSSQNNQNEPEFEIFKKIIIQSQKRINIFEVYTDLIQLKMAIKILLTKDQYAALQFCGSEMIPNDSFQNQIGNRKMSHVKIKPKQLEETTQNQKFQNVFSESKTFQTKSNLFNENSLFKYFSSQNMQRIPINDNILSPKQQETSHLASNNSNQIEEVVLNNDPNITQRLKEKEKNSRLNINSINDQFQKRDQYSISEKNISEIKNKEEVNETKTEQIKKEGTKCFEMFGSSVIELPFSPKSKGNVQFQCKRSEKVQNYYSHLQLMDLIEDNQEIQEQFLKQFLRKMENRQNQCFNHVDQQIFQSLLVKQQQQDTNYEHDNNDDDEEENLGIPNEKDELEQIKDSIKEERAFKCKMKNLNI